MIIRQKNKSKRKLWYSLLVLSTIMLGVVGMSLESEGKSSYYENFDDYKEMKGVLSEIEEENEFSELVIDQDYIEAKSIVRNIEELIRSYQLSNEQGRDVVMVDIGFNISELEQNIEGLEEEYL